MSCNVSFLYLSCQYALTLKPVKNRQEVPLLAPEYDQSSMKKKKNFDEKVFELREFMLILRIIALI